MAPLLRLPHIQVPHRKPFRSRLLQAAWCEAKCSGDVQNAVPLAWLKTSCSFGQGRLQAGQRPGEESSSKIVLVCKHLIDWVGVQYLEQMAARYASEGGPPQPAAASRVVRLGRMYAARRQRQRREGGHLLSAASARPTHPWDFEPTAVDSEVLKQQLCYTWALHERRAHLLEAADEVKALCRAMQQNGRPGELARLDIARVAAVPTVESPVW